MEIKNQTYTIFYEEYKELEFEQYIQLILLLPDSNKRSSVRLYFLQIWDVEKEENGVQMYNSLQS